ncbi:GNAT family N-acetyltransferase [Xenorhabdus innexi]|uniref:N-acetyltransferase n=1 Tax=Xenorhabdus innexi TaxID=290109 RepID=A0A1N6N1M6_9GAMM|nr:GNAT family N-acetyltransferase [Xenorhabdus innexi]PHM37231.1 N-acetyltransferase [Xenorhabdus innexi]SIP74986.1 conserved hypothetical protein [Xenorhabdus innexi]
MFRLKFFNTHRPVNPSSLTRAESFSKPINIRYSIVIREVSIPEALSATNIVKKNMANDWLGSHSSDSLDAEQQRWHERYSEALDMFDNIIEDTEGYINNPENANKAKNIFFVAYLNGTPVGTLGLSMNHKTPKIISLATHCGIRGCGVLLVEYAVNKSQQLGKKGKLKLQPFDKARLAYTNMGFMQDDGNLKLNPAKRTDKWIWDESSKRYKYIFC